MEREIAVIRPKGVNHIKQAVTLTATYNIKGKEITLTSHGDVRQGNIDDGRGDIRFDGSLTIENKIFGESFDEVEDQIDFWSNHPMVENVNSEPKPNSRFTIEIFEDTKAKKRAKTVSVNKVVSSVYGMSEAERKDVMYFFKQDPREMSDDDITLALVDIVDGLLLREPNTTRFLETFGSLGKAIIAERVEMLVYVNKGIATGFVNEDSDKFYIGDVLIGKDEDDIALFFKDNPQMYDNLVRSLAKGGDETAYNDANEDTSNLETPFAVKMKWEKLYKSYKMKGKFPNSLEHAIERINAYEKENGMRITK
jgi:hypothetical protein